MSSRRILLLLFFLVLAFELAMTAFLIFDKRLVIGHDGFEMLAHQWFFLNGRVSYGEYPLWTPYMSHGIPMWWNFIRMDVFLNSLMVFADSLKGMNFLPFFYTGLFFDKFILLVGVWLLGKRYFNNPLTIFFVAVTVMASTVTLSQVSFPLVLFYSIPLTLYLLHRFFDTYNFKWLFLAVFLFCVLSINIYYFIPIISLAIFLYFLVYHFSSGEGLFKHARIAKKDFLWLAGIFAIGILLVVIASLVRDPLMHMNTVGRQLDGNNSLEIFLKYAGRTDLLKWWELFLGMSPQLDYTVYMGLLSLPLIVIGCTYSKNPYKYPILFGAVFFILFACATPVSLVSYYIWPLMKLFRHIGLIAPLIKLYLCFLAGFGFEQLFDSAKAGNSKSVFQKSIIGCIILLLNGLFLCQLIKNPQAANFMMTQLGEYYQSSIVANFSQDFISDSLFYMAVFSFVGAAIFLVRSLVGFPRYAASFIFVLMLVHVTDLYWYASQQVRLRSFPLTQEQYQLFDFQKIPFEKRRYDQADMPGSRDFFMMVFQGTKCDSINNFTFKDPVRSKYRSDFCLEPFDRLLKTFNYQTSSESFLKLAGSTEDKIQFFSDAYPSNSYKAISQMMKNKKYAGDVLFYLYPGDLSTGQKTELDGVDLSANHRLKLSYEVVSFSPNQIIVDVDTSNQEGVWLQYSDIWHQNWKAEVNGKPENLYMGSLAYKAVPLAKGKNLVKMYIESKPIEYLYYFFAISSLIWIFLLIWLVFL